MAKVPKTVERDVVLEYVNTQIGHLNSTIRKCKEADTKGALEQLRYSMTNLKTGLESDKWSPDII